MAAEPRRVPFISLSPVRRREGESPALEREPVGREPEPLPAGREAPLLAPPPEPPHELCRPEPPPPRETAARLEPPREIGRPEQQPQREPPRPEPPPLPPPQQLPSPPPRQGSRQEPPPPQEALPLRQTVRLEVVLKDPTEEGCVEFSYPELLLCGDSRVRDLPFPLPSCPTGPRRASSSFSSSPALPISVAPCCSGVVPAGRCPVGGGKSGGLAVAPGFSWR